MNEAKVKYDELTAYTIKILEKLGYPKAQADVTAWALVEADARGVNSHGVGRLDFYESNIKNGFNIPAAEPEVVHETPLSVVIDGRHGVGADSGLLLGDRRGAARGRGPRPPPRLREPDARPPRPRPGRRGRGGRRFRREPRPPGLH